MLTKSRIFLYFCLAFVAGVALSSYTFMPQLFLLGFLIAGLLLISALWHYKKIVVVGFCLLFFVLGIWRHQQAISKIVYPEEQNITFAGTVAEEPDVRSNDIKLTIKSDEQGSGRILVTTNRYSEYRYGDELRITGELQAPQGFAAPQSGASLAPSGRDEFNYRGYLAKDGIYSVMYWPEVELIAENRGNFVYARILELKNKLRESIYQNLSPPQSSILGAMILGDKRKMSDELKEKLNIAGVRHITAVSGLHVTILAGILMAVFLGLHLGKAAAFYSTITLIILFIIMTGLQPSAVRAVIMGGLFILAQYLGRQSISSRTIVFAAAAMLAQNPMLLRLDVGFQLSFLAIMGIIYLAPAFKKWLKNDILAMTFSAYFFTLPILIYNFGYVSLAAPLVNFLIVPMLYWIMISGFIFGFLGMLWQPLGWILSWPVWLLLSYVIEIVDWFSSLSLAFLAIKNLPWIWLIISYLFLGFLIRQLKKKADSISFLR